MTEKPIKLKTAKIVVLGLFCLFLVSCEKEVREEKIFTELEITRLPDKTTYKLGEVPDFTGLEVAEVFTDGTKTPNTFFKTSWDGNIFKKGKNRVVVQARNRLTYFDITFEEELIDTGLPIVYIDTDGGSPVVEKKEYVDASMTIRQGGKILSEHRLKIRGRGNATWTYPKKPYKLKLDEKADLLGMQKDKKWALLANYCDKTLLRTGIAFKLSRLMNFPWTPEARFVDVVLNGEYLGNYQLTETIDQGSNRINIPKDGFVVERDGYYDQEPLYFVSSRGYGYSFKNPDPDDELTPEQRLYIKDYIDEFETVLASSDFADPQRGYTRFLDIPSFVRWFIFQNILANMDTNVYLTKEDMSDSKLYMGPVWDFEWSIGIGWYYGPRPRPEDYYVWNSNAFYYDRLLQDPLFRAEVKNLWERISFRNEILEYIDSTAALIQKSRELNFKRWDIMNEMVSVGGVPMGSYEAEVQCDRQFFIKHNDWLDREISAF